MFSHDGNECNQFFKECCRNDVMPFSVQPMKFLMSVYLITGDIKLCRLINVVSVVFCMVKLLVSLCVIKYIENIVCDTVNPVSP